ncbi:MAG: hypothetical protein SFX18_17075 [Pirellulales bacterium]|nr:hypothetical protein [Pirellulales bacterium]
MANTNRAPLLNKLTKALRHYKVSPPPKDRPLMETLLYAACLENSPPAAADAAFENLQTKFVEWNEVRVSTITELAEAMSGCFEPTVAAANMKRVLQGVFEAVYSFDLEALKKQNLGAAVKQLEKMANPTPFILNYAVQHSLGGHAIPLDRGAWETLVITGIATPQEAATGALTGLERAIPKNKGQEFASQLHQLGAEYLHNPQAPAVRKLLSGVNSAAVFPKRGESALKLPDPPPKPEKTDKKSDKPEAEKSKSKTDKTPKGKESVKAEAKAPAKSDPPRVKKGEKSPDKPADKGVDKSTEKTTDKSAEKSPEKAKSAGKSEPKGDGKKSANGKAKPAAAKKSPTKQLAKRKPR